MLLAHLEAAAPLVHDAIAVLAQSIRRTHDRSIFLHRDAWTATAVESFRGG
jgi:hypothetical protein